MHAGVLACYAVACNATRGMLRMPTRHACPRASTPNGSSTPTADAIKIRSTVNAVQRQRGATGEENREKMERENTENIEIIEKKKKTERKKERK